MLQNDILFQLLMLLLHQIIIYVLERIDDKIRDEKLQYDINREAAKISALSFGKIDKYEYFMLILIV